YILAPARDQRRAPMASGPQRAGGLAHPLHSDRSPVNEPTAGNPVVDETVRTVRAVKRNSFTAMSDEAVVPPFAPRQAGCWGQAEGGAARLPRAAEALDGAFGLVGRYDDQLDALALILG